MRPLSLFSLLLTPASLLHAQTASAAHVIAEYRALGARPLWPGFDPATIPVAIFDGDTTWLAGHPHPPADTFRLIAGGLFAMPGRHALVTANSSTEIGGVTTATLLFDPVRPDPARAWAGTLIHEAFHAHQRVRHKDWSANEAEFFIYPVHLQAAQRLQRLETEAWRRALQDREFACWGRAALGYRRLRFALLPVGGVAYERGTELNEGLASYVQFRAEDRATLPFPTDGFAPDGVRLRGYIVGAAIGRLLDRAAPGWRELLERGPTRSLDETLADAIVPGASCRFRSVEEDSIRRLARRDVDRVRSTRIALRDSVLTAPGWRIEILADTASPLWPERFDPWNVVALEGGAVVHRRFLRLAKDGLVIEVLDRTSLTEPAGAHPLFNGLRRLVVSGLPEEPAVIEQPGRTTLTTPGVRIEGRVARLQREGTTLRLFAGP